MLVFGAEEAALTPDEAVSITLQENHDRVAARFTVKAGGRVAAASGTALADDAESGSSSTTRHGDSEHQ